MTVTAEQAKAMLDAADETTRIINLAYEGGLLVELDIEARHHANSVQQLAATVVELHERLATIEAERDQLREDLGLANEVIETLEEQVSNARIAGRGIEIQRDALQAAIDKVLALHVANDVGAFDAECFCDHCGYEWPCPTVQALTQGGEGL
jgi:uncharacterized coiled-coil DUF342 family protein